VVVFLKPDEHIFVIFIKTDFGYPVLALWFYCSQTLKNYLTFQSFNLERNLLKVIPETHRAR
jgi:hypothetical protein